MKATIKPMKGVTVPKQMTASAAGGLGRLEKSAMAPKPSTSNRSGRK